MVSSTTQLAEKPVASGNFFGRIDEAYSRALRNNDSETLDLLKSLSEWIKTGKFSSYSKAADFMRYIKQPDSVTANAMGISPTTVRVHRRNLSNELFEKLGTDFFNVSIVEQKRRFLVATFEGNSHELLGTSLVVLLKSIYEDEHLFHTESYKAVDIQTCLAELNFLRELSVSRLRTRISGLDSSKLRFLIGLIDGEVTDYPNKVRLIETLLGE